MKSATEIEKELVEFCPELHPNVRYGPDGIEVRCDWGLQYLTRPTHPIEHAKHEMIKYLYRHLGELTVLIYRLEQ